MIYIPLTLFAAIILFVTSSHVDLLEQTAAHEETHARIGVHTNKISTIDRDNNSKEGMGLRRSPMLVSEKSSHGHGTGTGTAGSTPTEFSGGGPLTTIYKLSPGLNQIERSRER